jgi:hypothetical protein
MRTLDLVPGRGPSSLAERFEVGYVDERGEQRLPLAEVLSVPFKSCLPVRGFPSYKGQRHSNGRWWTSTTQTLVATSLGWNATGCYPASI